MQIPKYIHQLILFLSVTLERLSLKLTYQKRKRIDNHVKSTDDLHFREPHIVARSNPKRTSDRNPSVGHGELSTVASGRATRKTVVRFYRN